MARKLGLALGSGAARGWAHIGVLRGLEEIGVKPDVIAGCSVGALVGGAYLLGALDIFAQWARELKPLSALGKFNFVVRRGGLIDAAPAFDAFREYDKFIEELDIAFGAVAADIATGEEVALTSGSVIDAARASSAIPVLFHAVQRNGRWLVDGALVNPAPVSLARQLGAEIVVSIDLNGAPRILDRFDAAPPRPPAIIAPAPRSKAGLTGAVAALVEDTKKAIRQQVEFARARADATPHLFETAYAAADIFQMHLARARFLTEPADILLQPDMRNALPTSFDRADEFIEEGRRALMAHADKLTLLLK